MDRHVSDSGGLFYPPETEADLIAELRRSFRGPHSPALRQLLNRVYADPAAQSLILVTLRPFREWAIARLPQDRSQPVTIERDRIFTSEEEAEWALFCRHWLCHTGRRII